MLFDDYWTHYVPSMIIQLDRLTNPTNYAHILIVNVKLC